TAAGDVNGDGYADFVVGSIESAHVYLGSATPAPAAWLGPSAPSRIDLTTATAADDFFGATSLGTGDVNGDGYTDFVVGAFGFQTNVGAAELYLGSPTPSSSSWNGANPSRRVHLSAPNGSAIFAGTIGGGGDIDGDLNSDFAI